MVEVRQLVSLISTKNYFPPKKASFILAFFLSTFAFADYVEVEAIYETPPVITEGDAADDPAIWVNKNNPSNSIIFGTDKKSGIYSYNLQGQELSYTNLGRINNVDTRSMNLGDDENVSDFTFLFGSNRTLGSVDLWVFEDNKTRQKLKNNSWEVPSKPSFRGKSNIIVYGICAGIDPKYGLVAFLTEDTGPRVEVWNLTDNGLDLITTFNNGGESEGCVYDDFNRTLFISEEEVRGVLKAYRLDDSFDFSEPYIVDSREGQIGGDPEGVSLYKTSNNSGYLILSSQGDSKFNLYDRNYPYDYITSFRIGSSKSIDNVTDTDGIETINFKLSDEYPEGIMIAQDGLNKDGYKTKRQNFKIVSFKDVLDALTVPR
ncbi:phytase [SAR86 cluster bacterium]|nr:phytase [SAR86 cluster bacterium]